ncbi:MAG: glycosyl hydrolase family 18 protein [Pseudonocardiaceae bacterium]
MPSPTVLPAAFWRRPGQRTTRSARGSRRAAARLLTALVSIAALVAGGIGMYRLLARPYRLPLVIGAVPFWDLPHSLPAVINHRHVIDEVTPWWYSLGNDGSVISEVPGGAAAEQGVLNRLAATGVGLVPSIADTTDHAWAPMVIQAILHDPTRRHAHEQQLATFATTRGFTGLQIDYEDLTLADRDVFTQFIGELADTLHACGKTLYVTVHPKTTDAGYDQRNLAQDYPALGRSADKIIVMAYDWRWSTSAAGPIAPLSWVTDVLRYASSRIPADKLVLGLGLYGYDWVGQQGQAITWQQADTLAHTPGVTSGWDPISSAPHLSYDRDGAHHEVWYENAHSLTPKLDLATTYHLGGVELWRLGAQDPGLWTPLTDRHHTAT